MRRDRKPAKSNKAKPPVARKSPEDDGARVRDLEGRLAEALEQQRASGEILRVISSSPTDLQPVLDAIATNAALVCDAYDAVAFLREGDRVRYAAHYGPITITMQRSTLSRGSITEAAILDRQPVHVHDVLATEPPLFPLSAEAARRGGFRTALSVPLLRGNEAIGALAIRRREVRPFTTQQVDLLKTFADQAVIAIENVRLFKELEARNRDLTVALDQQTATAAILRVISQSPTDVQPVFDAIASSAVRLCESSYGVVHRFDGTNIELPIAMCNVTDEQMALYRRIFPLAASMDTSLGESALTRRTVHVADTQAEHRYTTDTEAVRVARDVFGYRTVLMVPMVHRDETLGIIAIWRREQQPFSPKQIALVETFADQAVIAIENVRLFNETKEALERQTATSEILRVISQSPTDLTPVARAIAENAARLCETTYTAVFRFDGELIHWVAAKGASAAQEEALRTLWPRPATPERLVGRTILAGTTLHIEDVAADPTYTAMPAARMDLAIRTVLNVPMLRGGQPVGVIGLIRSEVKPFSAREISLVQMFADQAVIAIENVRLFTELQASNRELTTALDKQTATSDILRVISQSSMDAQPVFETILTSAVRLMGAYAGTITRVAGDHLDLAALKGTEDRRGEAAMIKSTLTAAFPLSLQSQGAHATSVRNRAPVNIALAQSDPRVSEAGRAIARAAGYQSMIAVPLLHRDVPVGTISVTRREPGGFSNEEITLLQTFADQAVIAIENVRLFTELQEKHQALTQAHAQVSESLEQQTATSEVLRVIASSPTELQPVLDAMVESVARLCGVYDAVIWRLEGDGLRPVAHHGPVGSLGDRVVPVHRGTVTGRTVLDRQTVQVTDLQAEVDEFPEGSAFARQFGHRSIVSVPLLREGVAIGVMSLRRAEVQPFTEKQIDLLQTFADQAVIAIENVRLFTELQEKNRALTQAHAQVSESLEQQTATSEVLKVISRSAFDLQPVLDTLIENAVRLCGADRGFIHRQDGEFYPVAASYGHSPEWLEVVKRNPIRLDRTSATGRAAVERRVIHIADILADPEYRWAENQRGQEQMHRTILSVPMLREGTVIGVITIRRLDVQPFTDKQVQLVATFADQAVIAIENVRLFTELQARTQELTRSVGQLTALGEVGQAVSSSLDLETVLTTIVSLAVQLSGLDGGVVFEYDAGTETFVQRAAIGTANRATAAREEGIRRGEGVVGRTALTLRPVQIPDISVAGAYEGRIREDLIAAGVRALVAVPILREGRLIGGLAVNRNQPGEFSPDTVELLQTFAAQSALAIENARLFREIEEKSRELEAASQHKSEFLANMSHELRTPLNAIIGFSEVLGERMFGELNDKQDEYLKDIHASGQHLLSLINDILDLSKIEAGRMELELTEFDLPTAIENSLTLVRERAGRRSIVLQTNIDARLSRIQADERKVRQVILNLLSNAIKFTPEGGRIEIAAAPEDGFAEISVSDTGVGIAPEDQEAVFEEFRQVGTADKKVEGTGLGLTLCRKFVELHGGRIWLKSELGVGSTFTFSLPLQAVANDGGQRGSS